MLKYFINSVIILLTFVINSFAGVDLAFDENSITYDIKNTEGYDGYIDLTIRIRNLGDSPSPETQLKVEVIYTSMYGVSGEKEFSISEIPANGFIDYALRYDFLWNHNGDDHELCGPIKIDFFIDCGNSIFETNEVNNSFTYSPSEWLQWHCPCIYFLRNQCYYNWTSPILHIHTVADIFASEHQGCYYSQLSYTLTHESGARYQLSSIYTPYYDMEPSIDKICNLDSLGIPYGRYTISVYMSPQPVMVPCSSSDNLINFASQFYYSDLGTTIPDIYIKSPGTFPTTCPSSSFTHDLTIGNSGGTLEQSFKVCIYASQDQNITTSDYKLGCFTVTPSHFGSSNYCNLSITCDPSGLSGGMWYFGIIVDPDNELDEDNENDNSYCSSTSTSVEGNSTISVTAPNGGESWELGSTHTLRWSSNAGGSVKIYLYKQGSYYKTITSSTTNDGSYTWTIPQDYDEYSSYRISVISTSNNNVQDYSDGYFSLYAQKAITITSPNGGEEWETGSTHNITWTSNAGGSVKIHLFKQGTFYKEITNSTNNDGSFSWAIPADYDEYSSYRIRITSTSNSDVYDYSDNYFSLKKSEQTDMVWPGDTNNSGYVDQADVLPIGLYFHLNGPRRSLSGNSWRGYEMSNWSNKAAGYADSDGSGTVDQGDVLAIGLNWHKSHTASLAKAHSNIFDHSLLLQLENGIDSRGLFIDIAAQNADGLTGISFDLNLNLNKGNITSIEYQDVFQTDRIQYENIQADKLALGVSLKNDKNAVNGNAKICRIYYQGQHVDHDIQLSNIIGMNIRGEYIGAVSEAYSLACGQIIAPDKLVLYPNYPNPFNPITTIRYDVPESGVVRLDILNVKGEVVRTLVNQEQAVGSYSVQWDATRENGSKVASGVYLYRIQAGNQQFIQKLLYTK